MVEKEKSYNYSIKGKLVSAVAMLLVAVIMVVSSTYAWFTLSTAPEVTGISTAVGANGALEILLATKDETGKWIYNDGVLDDANDSNTYWGNLVDLSKAIYGSGQIVLYPATLNKVNGAISDNPIKIPKYNAYGKVESLIPTGMYGTFNGTNSFIQNNNYGFRALGVASGLSTRQQAFRSALGEIGTAQGSALIAARRSLSDNGTTLASIAVRHSMDAAATFSSNDVAAIGRMLNGLEGSLRTLENAYINALSAIVLSALNDANDVTAEAAASVVQGYLNATEKSEGGPYALGERIAAAITAVGLGDVVTDNLLGYSTFTNAVASVNAALGSYNALEEKDSYTWDKIDDSISALINTNKIIVNDMPISQVNTEEGKGKVIAMVAGGQGITVTIPTGGGVYADIADICEDYTVDIVLNTKEIAPSYGVDVAVNAKMKAQSDGPYKYLTNLRAALNTAANYPTSGASAADQPLTEIYGYVIDLAFKTNAAASNLLLQYDATDRIYGDNNNEATMGGGSTMTFAATAAGFSETQVKSLMSKLRVVFFNPVGNAIYAEARLDMVTATVGVDGVTAQIKIYETYENRYEYTESSGNTVTLYAKTVDSETKYYTDEDLSNEYNADPLVAANLKKIDGAFADKNSAVISNLDQNVIKHVSALVYLDGETITNADVAATAASSMIGTVNLQFASSATLVPMEYGDLHIPDGNTSSAEESN